MAVLAKYSRVLVDGFDLSTLTGGIALAIQVGQLEHATLQGNGVEVVAGDSNATLTHRGLYQGQQAGKLSKVLTDRLGTTQPCYVTAVFDTNGASPSSFHIETAWGNQLNYDAEIAALLALEGAWTQGQRAYNGYELFRGLISGVGAKPSIDLVTPGTLGGVAFFHVYQVTGTAANAAVTVQCDDNTSFTTPTTLGTFTFSGNSTTGLQAAKVSLGAGAVDRHLRINASALGGATSFALAAYGCINGLTY
jgi:hypothetical protein